MPRNAKKNKVVVVSLPRDGELLARLEAEQKAIGLRSLADLLKVRAYDHYILREQLAQLMQGAATMPAAPQPVQSKEEEPDLLDQARENAEAALAAWG
jgi:hypothetical protein